MTPVLPGVFFGIFGMAVLALGRWGRRHADDLVPAIVPEPRRIKDLRTIRRGATSCVVFGAVCLVNAVVFLVVAELTG